MEAQLAKNMERKIFEQALEGAQKDWNVGA